MAVQMATCGSAGIIVGVVSNLEPSYGELERLFYIFSISQLSEKYHEIEQKQKPGMRHDASTARQNNKSHLHFT